MKITTSKRFAVNFLDIARGFLVAAITAVVVGCGQMIEIWMTSPTFSMDKVNLMMILKTAIGGGIAYLLKNFFTPSRTVIKGATPEETKSVVDSAKQSDAKP